MNAYDLIGGDLFKLSENSDDYFIFSHITHFQEPGEGKNHAYDVIVAFDKNKEVHFFDGIDCTDEIFLITRKVSPEYFL